MKQSIAVRIPTPCHEDWKAMTPAEQGRFCNACSKVVVDFTTMDNNEIIAYFGNATSSGTCGRFNHYQLDRPLEKYEMQYPAKGQWDWFKKVAAIVITGCSLLLASCNRRSDIKGKVIGESMALDSQHAISKKIVDTVPIPAVKEVEKKSRVKMGKTKIETEILKGDVEVIHPEIIQGITIMMPDNPEKLPVESVDTFQNKKQ